MAVPNYPGITSNEIDLTTNIPLSENSSYAALCGNFEWGPCEEINLVSSENVLIDTFGKPTSATYIDWFSAANYLLYASSLKVVRVVDTAAKNAVTGNTACLVKNSTHYEQEATKTNSGHFIARYPGTKGNSLYVAAIDSGTTFTSNIHPTAAFGSWDDYFQSEPGTSDYASSKNGSLDEMHIIVVDEDGNFSGTPGTILEKFAYVSKAVDAIKEDGTNNFYATVINSTSRYIRVGDTYILNANSSALANTTFSTGTAINSSLALGANPTTANSAMYINAIDLFSDKKVVDISHIISGDAPTAAKTEMVTVAETRGDCVAYISPEWSDVQPGQTQSTITSNIISYKNSTLNINSSYTFFDNNWKYQYDKYADVYRWIPCNADVAGLSARTDLTNEAWVSPAGYNRGILRNVAKLAWNSKEEYMGSLYKAGINSIIFEEGSGAVLFGDKTALSKPSAFDRINIRKLFNVLKRKITWSLRYTLFELNDEFTRDQVVSMLNSYLSEVKSRRGVLDYYVQCDESNNTGEVIDSNQLIVSVYVKPSRSINWIILNLVAARTGISFSEVIGRF